MAERHQIHFDQPRSVFSTWVGVVLLFLVFGLIVLVLLAAMNRGDDYELKRAQAREQKLKDAHKEWDARLQTYGWADKSKGVAHVPIARAMELTVAELASQRPRMAGPIATPAPAPAVSPAANATTSPAVSASPTSQAAVTPAPTGPPDMRTNATPKPISVEGPNSEIRGQPTGAANPASAPPGTQPGPSATPAASPEPNAVPPAAGTQTISPTPPAPGTPLPVAGKTPVPNE